MNTLAIQELNNRLPGMGAVSSALACRRALYHGPRLASSRRLGETDVVGDSAITFYTFYHNLIVPILQAACAGEANAQQCASFQVQLQQIENNLNAAVANGDIGALVVAGFAAKALYDDVKNMLNPTALDPINPPPPPPPPPPSTGVPTWVWILGSVVVVGIGAGVVYAVTKRK